MKKIITNYFEKIISKWLLFSLAFLSSVQSYAQDKKVDVDINTKSDNGGGFFMQPWVWVVGGAVFLLLLVALLRNNNSKA